MRLRIIFLVVATSSLILVSFLLPLAIVLRTQAADRAISTATIQAQGLTPLVAAANWALPRPGLRPYGWRPRAAASPPPCQRVSRS